MEFPMKNNCALFIATYTLSRIHFHYINHKIVEHFYYYLFQSTAKKNGRYSFYGIVIKSNLLEINKFSKSKAHQCDNSFYYIFHGIE